MSINRNSNERLQESCRNKIYEIAFKYFNDRESIPAPPEVIEGDKDHYPIRMVAAMELDAMCHEYCRLNTPLIENPEMCAFFHQENFVDEYALHVITVEEFLRRLKLYDTIRVACKTTGGASGDRAICRFAYIQRSASNAQRVILHFLKSNDMASIKSERAGAYMEEFVMAPALRDVVRSCGNMLNTIGKELKVHPDTKDPIRCDLMDIGVAILTYMMKLGISCLPNVMDKIEIDLWSNPELKIASRKVYLAWHNPITNKAVVSETELAIDF